MDRTGITQPRKSNPMEHLTIEANGASFHVARTGAGRPLLLLHGWPEFWLSWEPVMKRLADRYTLIAPDLRGFGDSAKPAGPFGPADHAADMLALLDALGVARVGVIGHDVGGAAMQPLARTAPERLAGLFFFDFVYPGIGPRMAAPDRLNEIWYQSFNQMEMAPGLVGATRDSCRTFIAHFLRHWSHRKEASRRPCRPDPHDEGRGPSPPRDHGADLLTVARARSAVSVRLDRPAWREFQRSRPRALSGRRTLSPSRRSRSRRSRDRGLLPARGSALKSSLKKGHARCACGSRGGWRGGTETSS